MSEMNAILVKVCDDPAEVAEALGELKARGFKILFTEQAKAIGVDTQKAGGAQQGFGAGWVVIGTK